MPNNKYFSAPVIAFLILLVSMFVIGLIVTNADIETSKPSPTPTIEVVFMPAVEALPLSESYDDPTGGVSFMYPEGWTINKIEEVFNIYSVTPNPLTQDVLQFTSVIPSSEIIALFGLDPTLETTSQALIEDYAIGVAQNATLLEGPIAYKTAAYNGTVVSFAQSNPQTGGTTNVQIGILDIASDEFVLFIVTGTTVDIFEQITANAQVVLGTLVLSEPVVVVPTSEPTEAPSPEPTELATEMPTVEASETPEVEPTQEATVEPTIEPTEVVTEVPTIEATETATIEPLAVTTNEPTIEPTEMATEIPTTEATELPTVEPTETGAGLPLEQTYEDTTGELSFLYPEAWTVEKIEDVFNIYIISPGPTIPDNLQFTSVISVDEVLTILRVPLASGVEATSQTLIEAFMDAVAQNAILSEPAAAYETNGYDGSALSFVSLDPTSGTTNNVQIGILDIGTNEFIVFVISSDNSDRFDEIKATTQAILGTLVLGEQAASPTTEPTEVATEIPTIEATEMPTEVPSMEATEAPTTEPTEVATEMPTIEATEMPAMEPTEVATEMPTVEPTEIPTEVPTIEATDTPVEDGRFGNETNGLSVITPEGFEAATVGQFINLTTDTKTIRITVGTSEKIATRLLGLRLETMPEENVAETLLSEFSQLESTQNRYGSVGNVGTLEDLELSGATVTARTDETAFYFALIALEDGQLVFYSSQTPLSELREFLETQNMLLQSIQVETR